MLYIFALCLHLGTLFNDDISEAEADEDKKCLNDDKDQSFLTDTRSCDEEILISSVEEKEEVLQPRDSPEPQKVMKSGKYNLRKSLAWDNAFFTSDGKCISYLFLLPFRFCSSL